MTERDTVRPAANDPQYARLAEYEAGLRRAEGSEWAARFNAEMSAIRARIARGVTP